MVQRKKEIDCTIIAVIKTYLIGDIMTNLERLNQIDCSCINGDLYNWIVNLISIYDPGCYCTKDQIIDFLNCKYEERCYSDPWNDDEAFTTDNDVKFIRFKDGSVGKITRI